MQNHARCFSFHIQTCCWVGLYPSSHLNLSKAETAFSNHLHIDSPQISSQTRTNLLCCFQHFSLILSSSDYNLPASQASTGAWSRHQQGFGCSGDTLTDNCFTFSQSSFLLISSTLAQGLATPSNARLPSLLLGHAPRPRSNLVLLAITVQKSLQQLAQAGSISYKKLTQLSISQSF